MNLTRRTVPIRVLDLTTEACGWHSCATPDTLLRSESEMETVFGRTSGAVGASDADRASATDPAKSLAA